MGIQSEDNASKTRLTQEKVGAVFLTCGSLRETAETLGVSYFNLSAWCNRKKRKTWWRGLRETVKKDKRKARNLRYRARLATGEAGKGSSTYRGPPPKAFDAVSHDPLKEARRLLTGPLE